MVLRMSVQRVLLVAAILAIALAAVNERDSPAERQADAPAALVSQSPARVGVPSDREPARLEQQSSAEATVPTAQLVHFPGQKALEIQLRKRPKDKHPLPNELMMNFGYYRELAREGDPEVAVKLTRAMRTCEIIAPPNEEDLESAISDLYQTRSLKLQTGQGAVMDLPAETDIHRTVADLRRIARNCWQLTDEDRVEAFVWVEGAAKQDYLPALDQLATTQRGTAEYLPTVAQMWELGDVHALSQLATAYRHGRGVAQDVVMAYAYDYLHSHIKTLDHQLNGSERTRLPYIDRVESELRDYEVAEGRELAREMLASNAQCCISWYRD